MRVDSSCAWLKNAYLYCPQLNWQYERTNQFGTRIAVAPSKDMICHSKVTSLCFCVHWFSALLTIISVLVSSRYWWYCRLDHACVTWINASRDISSLLVKILARDHGSLGLSVWSIDAIISSIFSSFSVSLCRRPLLLWGFGYFITDRLVHPSLPHDLHHLPSTSGRPTTHQPTRSRLTLSVIESIILSNNTGENEWVHRCIVDSGPRFSRGENFGAC